jgi:GNAT superfamily N-acetyltransferase
MIRRPFRSNTDAYLLQEFTAIAIRDGGRVGLMHPGDIVHRLYNGLRRENLTELIYIWEDARGAVLGWTLLDPGGAGFDSQISGDARRRYPRLGEQMNVFAEQELLRLLRVRKSGATHIETDANVNDRQRCSLLETLGWTATEDEIIWLSRRPLDEVAPPQLPDGYVLRTVRGTEEAGAVSALHAAGFGSSWTPELYQRVMTSPGYSAEREFVVEAPDGDLAAFCVTWPDQVNLVGLFEPVAVHPDYRRLGLGRAVMRAGMVAMREWGMRYAEVAYAVDNPASGPLYRGEGFEPVEQTILYRKHVSL